MHRNPYSRGKHWQERELASLSRPFFPDPGTWILKDASEWNEDQSGSLAKHDCDHNGTKDKAQDATHPLCTRCSRLSFYRIFRINNTLEAELPGYRTLKYLEDWHQTKSDKCAFCNLMLSVASNHDKFSSPTIFWSPSKLYQKYQPFSLIKMDYFNPSVAVPHQPFIVSSLAGGLKFVRLIQPDSIDFNIVSEWLDFCKSNHPECIERSVSINVENLRLIDCNNRRIVPACNHQYVSLSYVWGAPTKGTRVEDFTQVLPDDLPDTIEHSILATRALGFRYLWIDRYCIDRRDRTVFEAQLQQMGMIYKNSILTIVATAGNNDAYGLPGVGARHRRPQPFAHVDEHFLVSSMSDPTSLIKTSIWRTRGWTYQEGCLSTRRLFFTDEHVYYECQGSFHSEVLSYDIQDQHDRGVFERWEGGMGISTISPDPINDEKWLKCVGSVWNHVKEYSRREFTNSSDILDAFLGVMGVFESLTPPYRHLLGIPIPPAPPDSFYRSYFYAPLEGQDDVKIPSEAGFLSGLSWELAEPSSRRHEFPSWSWMGWNSCVKHPGSNQHTLIECHVSRDIAVEVELEGGRLLPWQEFMQYYNQVHQRLNLCHEIHVSAWASPLKMLKQDGNTVVMKFDLNHGKYMHWSFTATAQGSLSVSNTYYAVWLWLGKEKWTQRDDHTGPSILVVVETANQDGVAERVGFGGIWQSSCVFFDASGNQQPSTTDPALSGYPKDTARENWADGVWLDGPDMFPKAWRSFLLG